MDETGEQEDKQIGGRTYYCIAAVSLAERLLRGLRAPCECYRLVSNTCLGSDKYLLIVSV